VIGLDPLADLALLKVIGKESPTPYLKFADNTAEIEEGMEVFTLGHPMGMAWTVTKGIISSNERYARHPYVKTLQTDAAINTGNSGGPLLNMKGEIIGINALIISRIKENAGVGMAIRGDIVKKSLESMIEIGKVERPAVGIMISELADPKTRDKLIKEYPTIKPESVPSTLGLYIRPDDNIPKGLKAHDTIIGVNDVMVNSGLQFSDELMKYNVGDQVTLTLIRERRYIKVDVTLKVFPVPVEQLYKNRNQLIPGPVLPEKKEKKP
jgi:serine protease Do